MVAHDDIVGDVAAGEDIVVRADGVASPSPVALWIVTHSRMVLWSPISVRVSPPFHFRSCVFRPILAKG